MSVPAGPEITKLPLSQISQSMSAYRPTAAVIGPNPHRPLQAENWAVAPLRLKSRSGRFAIKSPAFSDVRNAHIAVGRWVLGERQFMSGNGQVADPVPQLVLAAVLISQ